MNPIILEELASGEKVVHLMSDREHWSIKAAIAANRPLLVRGEPGTGKTQLARAAAINLNRPLVSMTVDSSTESRDLMWTFDAVQRLAEAQVIGNLECDRQTIREELAVGNFVRPGPLWWAFDWNSATNRIPENEEPPALMPQQKSGVDPWVAGEGVVILIDEIDKAESDVPNGLLEALGSRSFRPNGCSQPVTACANTEPPLIIITTNEERVLPPAFLRRCLIITLELPSESSEEEFVRFLCERGELHFPKARDVLIGSAGDEKSEPLSVAAARILLSDRKRAIQNQDVLRPGLAEYLDLIRAVMNLTPEHDPNQVFGEVKSFIVNKSDGFAR